MEIVRRITSDEWRLLREARLHALADAPYAFSSNVDAERHRPDEWWMQSTERLAWYVAVEGDTVVGLVAGLPIEDDGGARTRTATLISMWVDSGHRGTGTAGTLLRAVIGWARRRGLRRLELAVAEDNRRAFRFYHRAGFRLTGTSEPLRSNEAVAALDMALGLSPPRLRFAPSPAGALHAGHVRNAALTWILARRLDGDYFVRFENTDEAREVAGAREAIVTDLEWLGLCGGEPPHDQAAVMKDSYHDAITRLETAGRLYHDGGAVRFRIPSGGAVVWHDLARGRVTVRNEDLHDPVLVRASGAPTFALASTVDDVDDEVTHVLRPDVALRLTAVQVHIWRALGVEGPAGSRPCGHGPRRLAGAHG